MRISRESETKDRYTELGFKPPAFVENTYGIRIYIGTKGKDDWLVVIPKTIMQREFGRNQECAMYSVTEEHALSTAERFTRLARMHEERR